MEPKLLKRNTQILSVDNKEKYIVDSCISSQTGQGDIYKVHNDKGTFAMKLFHTGKREKLLKQFEALISRGKICSAYVYPLDIISHQGRVGYIMEYVGQEYKDASILYNGEVQGEVKVEIAFNEKLALLYNIIDAIRILNEANLGLMDIKFENIKINLEDGGVKILDTDTIVSTKSKSIVTGTIGFMPPLTMRGQEKPNKYNDYYAIAVMVFMTLFGSHPLIGELSEKPCNTNIEQYLFAIKPIYIFDKNNATNRPIPADKRGENQQRTINRMKKYPQYIKDAMHNTFVKGLYEGEKRTSPREWLDILEKIYNDSYACNHCGEELFYDGLLKYCDVCGNEVILPVQIACGDKKVSLFNGEKIFSQDLWVDSTNYEVFNVVVTKYDNKFGLYCVSREDVKYELKNGIVKNYSQGEILPIFLDGIITIGNKKIHFIGGTK